MYFVQYSFCILNFRVPIMRGPPGIHRCGVPTVLVSKVYIGLYWRKHNNVPHVVIRSCHESSML